MCTELFSGFSFQTRFPGRLYFSDIEIRSNGLLKVNLVQEHCFVRIRQHRPDSKTNIDSEMNIFGQTVGPNGSGRVREMYRNNIDNNNLSIVYFN